MYHQFFLLFVHLLPQNKLHKKHLGFNIYELFLPPFIIYLLPSKHNKNNWHDFTLVSTPKNGISSLTLNITARLLFLPSVSPESEPNRPNSGW